MTDEVDIEAIRSVIARRMDELGVSGRALARQAGIGQTSVRDVLERTGNPGIVTLSKIATALGIPRDLVNGRQRVPLVGIIGAGGEVSYGTDHDGHETVSRPPDIKGDMLAFEVLGDSMLPKYEAGDVIYILAEEGQPEKFVGEYCAIKIADGGTYLKMLSKGTSPGVFTLRSLNAADMTDVVIQWATPVSFIMPRRSRS